MRLWENHSARNQNSISSIIRYVYAGCLFVRSAVSVSMILACDIQGTMGKNIYTNTTMSICSALIILAALVSSTAVWHIMPTG